MHYKAGYVIMPNNLHTIIAFANTDKSINTIIDNGILFNRFIGKKGIAICCTSFNQW